MPADPVDRALDPGEAFFFLADRNSCMNFVMFAERRGQLAAERIRAGLAQLQQQNPLLRARITWTAGAGLRFQTSAGALAEAMREILLAAAEPGEESGGATRQQAEGVAGQA